MGASHTQPHRIIAVIISFPPPHDCVCLRAKRTLFSTHSRAFATKPTVSCVHCPRSRSGYRTLRPFLRVPCCRSACCPPALHSTLVAASGRLGGLRTAGAQGGEKGDRASSTHDDGGRARFHLTDIVAEWTHERPRLPSQTRKTLSARTAGGTARRLTRCRVRGPLRPRLTLTRPSPLRRLRRSSKRSLSGRTGTAGAPSCTT